MTKQHKLTRAYYSPLFANLQNPHLSLVASIEEKCDILLCNLFTNLAKVSNILFDSFTAATYKIDFSFVTVIDICKFILGAGNTTPSLDEISTAVLKTAQLLIESQILALFQACLEYSYYLASFQIAIAAIIPKLNKLDYTSF